MNNSPTQQSATGIWKFDINHEILPANKLYGTIYSNVVTLQGSRWQDLTGFDFRIDIVDSILGNGQQDLPPNGRYNYPLEKELIKVSYNGMKDGQHFDSTPQDGQITICLDPIKKLYYGHLDIVFLVHQKSLNIESIFGIQIP
ncbi:hypothetical protein [Pseudomonas sp. ANT_H12B]|uniref:hypothetical protein n=1 Tax=Pseudomonas sp. ANT_H12B TaxID=2597348 RepID=UPI0011EC984F|nr:hypothetical protein [Pseudomonas sp. ANT_H12B]KAA0960432.1 hypothetical protein FQ185_25420 [Pseudomonas sp. ANT_H12B]